jgi:SAM-dependent methyltransferase
MILQGADALQLGGVRALLWGPKELDTVLAWASLGSPRSVAELGCGRGFLGQVLLDRLPRARIHGFDLDPESVAAARAAASHLRGRLRFEEGDAADLVDVRDGAYDLVVMQAVLVHQSRPERVLNEASRILRPGGRILVVEPDVAADFSVFDPLLAGLPDPWPTIIEGAEKTGAGRWDLAASLGSLLPFGHIRTRQHPGRYRTGAMLTQALEQRDEKDERAHIELLGTLYAAAGGDPDSWGQYADGLAAGRLDRARALRAGTFKLDACGALHLATATRV